MTTAHIPEHAEIPPPALEEVGAGIFAYVQLDGSWGLNNTGFFVGSDGVAVVDTCFTEARTRAFVAAIGSVTDRPPRTLVNTHHHGDHTYGNYLLPGATIIGHRLCREEVVVAGMQLSNRLFPGVQWGELRLAPPFVTFDARLSIFVDDLELQLIYVGPAHTTNDVVVWVPERRLLFAGDVLFNGGTPFVIAGSVAGSLAALDRLRALDAETIVPGHGRVCGPEVIDDVTAYLRFARETARRGFDASRGPLEAAQAAQLGRFAAWHDTERLPANLLRAYAELRGEPLGGPIDLAPAFGDMLAYNGGRPLRCLA
jgi:cyclase